MAINGRIFVDIALQNTDGTASLKVVSLRSSDEYTTGKVAIVTGTCGTAEISVAIAPSTYKDASGNPVSFAQVSRIAFAANPQARMSEPGQGLLVSSDNRVCITDAEVDGVGQETISISTFSGTASYTLVLYGT